MVVIGAVNKSILTEYLFYFEMKNLKRLFLSKLLCA